MSRMATLFPEAERTRINQAVASAESRAAVEIVPVVARQSGRYDRAEDVVGLWLGVLALIATWFLLPRRDPEPGAWSAMPDWLQLVLLVLSVVVGFIIGAILASRIDGLRALFTSAQEKRDEVLARARQVFFDNRIHHTSGGSGILIYVSLLEHVATVLADRSVLDKLGQPAIDELCTHLTQRLKTTTPAEALLETIQRAGERTAAVLPRGEGQANQSPDALVVME